MGSSQLVRMPVRMVRLLTVLMIVLVSFSGVLGVPVAQAALRAFTPRFATTARGDIKLIGNALLTCPPAAAGCTTALAQTPPPNATTANIDDNDFTMANLDVDAVASTVNSSSADLALGTCNNVLFAGLYWSAISTSATRNQIQFGFGNPAPTYQLITASQLDSAPSGSFPNSYQSFADVTTQVQATGSGRYWGANVQANVGANTWAGWSLEVVCGDPTASLKRLLVYDGFQVVPPTPLTITLGNFFTPPVGSFTGALGMVSYDGDRGAVGDGATFNTDKVAVATTLTDALHPTNNFFNSSIADAGVNITTRNPSNANTLGLDITRITNNINQTTVGNGASSFTFKFTSSNETYEPGVFTFAMVVYEPEIFPVKTVTTSTAGRWCRAIFWNIPSLPPTAVQIRPRRWCWMTRSPRTPAICQAAYRSFPVPTPGQKPMLLATTRPSLARVRCISGSELARMPQTAACSIAQMPAARIPTHRPQPCAFV